MASLIIIILCWLDWTKVMISETNSEKTMMGFDMGNTQIRVFYGLKEILFYNSIAVQNANVYINKKPSISSIIDTTLLLNTRHEDQQFNLIHKYYHYIFKKGNNRNLAIKLHHKTVPEELYISFLIFLLVKGIFVTHPNLKYLMSTQNNLKMMITVFEGELNPFRLTLNNLFRHAGINDLCFVSSSSCIATSYLKGIMRQKSRDYTQVIGVVDFSDKGMVFTIFKLYCTPIGILEVLSSSFTYVGGNMLTNLIVDYVVNELVTKKGMDISKVSKLMHKLKVLCNEAKHVLSSSQMAYIRLDGLPDILVFGCQISESQFQKCIEKEIMQNVSTIKSTIESRSEKFNTIILHGGSCKIPSFKRALKRQLNSFNFIQNTKTWLGEGLLQIKNGRYHTMDVANFSLRMEGDQKFACNILQNNEPLPLRKHITMKFPTGELTYSMRFYQSNVLIGTCFIPERPRQNRYNLYIQVDKNKVVSIYATTSQGLIKMNCNMMEIGQQQFIGYQQLSKDYDFHNEND